jgi:hypothetical protein
MLHEYRDWLENAAAENDALKPALERFEVATAGRLFVTLERPLARRVLTSLELLGQQSTSLQPEFEDLRREIQIAFEEGTGHDREPLDREYL